MPGNTSDSRAERDRLRAEPQPEGCRRGAASTQPCVKFLRKIETQYGKAERIWVMDRGIPTEAAEGNREVDGWAS